MSASFPDARGNQTPGVLPRTEVILRPAHLRSFTMLRSAIEAAVQWDVGEFGILTWGDEALDSREVQWFGVPASVRS